MQSTWLAQLVEHVTLDLRVMSSSLMSGVEFTLKKKKREREGRLGAQSFKLLTSA